jgi:ATP-dependent DNA helicase RecG
MELSYKIELLPRIKKTTVKGLNDLGIYTVLDLINHFPFRYDDFSQSSLIKDLQPGEKINVLATIEFLQNKKTSNRKFTITESLVSDDSGMLKVIWFNQPFLTRILKPGDQISLAGKVEEDFGALVMKSPNYEKISAKKAIHTQGLIPIYHSTVSITQKQIRFLISIAMSFVSKISDHLPEKIKKENNFLNLTEAIKKIHFPNNQQDIDSAKKRLAFDELFFMQLAIQSLKNKNKQGAKIIKFQENDVKNFVSALPFKLTQDQRQASWEIIKDLEKDKPMTRLLEGDVGSGKTIVAAITLLNTIKNNQQVVLMVPSEILAKQHFYSFLKYFKNLNISIALLTSSNKISFSKKNELEKNDKKLLEKIKSGETDLIIGTHALIQEKINYKNLNLIVIDEQHRFGVEQRQTLVEKGKTTDGFLPHLLSMTATPIPRSLALALYDDLDVSTIKEMPIGRKKIITKIVKETEREKAYNFIKQEIKNGRQAFIICPLIDISDKLEFKSVKAEYEKLAKEIFPDLKISMIHGKLKSKEKEKIMEEFLNNKINILVATSVIEVGIDIPNASVMIIENSDRFGFAQLHQYRGRVGRGVYQSYCFLLANSENPQEIKRLKAMESCHNGFDLAKIDLKFRGPGEVYGTAQKGFPRLKLASLYDFSLMKLAKEEAKKIINQDPDLKNFPLLKTALDDQQNKKIYLE